MDADEIWPTVEDDEESDDAPRRVQKTIGNERLTSHGLGVQEGLTFQDVVAVGVVGSGGIWYGEKWKTQGRVLLDEASRGRRQTFAWNGGPIGDDQNLLTAPHLRTSLLVISLFPPPNTAKLLPGRGLEVEALEPHTACVLLLKPGQFRDKTITLTPLTRLYSLLVLYNNRCLLSSICDNNASWRTSSLGKQPSIDPIAK